LALVLDDNSLMAIDIAQDRVLYESRQPAALAVDTKIANPIFLERLVVFPTLDGKLVVVDPRTGRELRTIVAGKGDAFDNVIFLKVLDEKLVAATPSRVISISPQYTSSLDLEVRDLVYVDGRVYILTKDGRILLTDPHLRILKSRKYPFAHFTGAIWGEYLYLIEKEGYIIALDKDLMASNIFQFPTQIEEYIFSAKDQVFYDDRYFKLNRE
jgi:outer membrane protein assembly factor BamB